MNQFNKLFVFFLCHVRINGKKISEMFTDNMKNSHMQNVFYEGFIVLKHEHEVEDVKSRN